MYVGVKRHCQERMFTKTAHEAMQSARLISLVVLIFDRSMFSLRGKWKGEC